MDAGAIEANIVLIIARREGDMVLMEKERKINVSVVLSVYNTELYLKKCLNSLVSQTMSEIEIIAVNNGSTDGCPDILETYRSTYPDIFHVVTLKNNTGDPAEPWNIGIEMAKGTYISIVDSDDWCDISMFKTLFDAAIEFDAEVVLCDHFEVLGRDNFLRSKINAKRGKFSVNELVKNPHLAPWGKIIKKEVYIRNNLKYKSQIHCDTGLNLILYSFLTNVVYVDEALYFYNRLNPKSETNTKKRMRQASIVDTLDYILENYNKKWENEMILSIIRFLYWFCFTEYIFHQDIFIPFIKKHEPEIKRNKYLKSNQEGLRIVFNYLNKKMVPKRFIYDSFGKEKFSDLELRCIKSWEKFTDNYEFVLLNERNCNINENSFIRNAYLNKDFETVSNYFRLKELYNNGGIMLSTDMEMRGPIGELRMHDLTIGYQSANCLGDHVIAAMPHNFLIRRLCEHNLLSKVFEADTVSEEDFFGEYLNEKRESAISIQLNNYMLEEHYQLANQNILLKNDILLLSSDRLYYEINSNNLFSIIYEETYNLLEKPFIALHEDAIKSFSNYVNQLELTCRNLSSEVSRVTNSRSWRYLAPVRKFMCLLRNLKAKLFSA